MKLALPAVALLVLTACGSAAAGDTNCTPRTVQAGSEAVPQANAATMVQIPAVEPVRLTHLTISTGFAQVKPVGRVELLLLAGVADTPLTLGARQSPPLTPDPAFGPIRVDTGAAGHNENPAMVDGVLAARIYKSTGGSGGGLVDLDVDRAVPAGGVLWVRYGTVAAAAADPEIQIVATFAPAGCA